VSAGGGEDPEVAVLAKEGDIFSDGDGGPSGEAAWEGDGDGFDGVDVDGESELAAFDGEVGVGDFGALGEGRAVFEEAVAEGGEEIVGRDLGLGAGRGG
jgi:hypothetical protein